MKLVVDASVAVKWIHSEPGSREAKALVKPATELIAPDFMPLEVANVLWRLVRTKQMKAHEVPALLDLLSRAMSHLESSGRLLPRALALAIALDHPIYDCLYIALAEREGAILVTDDRRLFALGPKLKAVKIRHLMA